MKDTYKTISGNAEGLFKDKGSKFIAYAFPLVCDEEVKPIIQQLKKEHHTARHHCYAYRIGTKGENYRANDDGEPSGTAGRPILGQLLSNEITNILVVVVRYFGGTLLGVSGLINAYKNATSDVINNADVISCIVENKYRMKFDYPLQNFVMRIIKEEAINVIQTKFEMDCEMTIGIRLKKKKQALSKFEKIEGLKITELT